MQKFNFNTTLTRLSGELVTREFAGLAFTGDRKNEEEVEAYKTNSASLVDMIAHFVLEVIEVESRNQQGQAIPKKLSHKEKYDRYKLMEKIYERGDDGMVEITEDERQIIKSCTDVACNAELMGLVWRWLENPEAPVNVVAEISAKE